MAKRKAKSHRTDVIEVMEDGRTAYEYSDGAWRYDNGQLARRHPKALAPWNSEEATRQINGMHEAVREARLQALVASAQDVDPSIRTVPEAAALITFKQNELATSPDMGHASTQAAKYLDKTLSLVQESTNDQINKLTITMTDATAIATLAKLADKASGNSD